MTKVQENIYQISQGEQSSIGFCLLFKLSLSEPALLHSIL